MTLEFWPRTVRNRGPNALPRARRPKLPIGVGKAHQLLSSAIICGDHELASWVTSDFRHPAKQEVAEKRERVDAADAAEAVSRAAREFLRICRLCELTAMAVNLDYDENVWRELDEWS
jgi:hypothetical protein